MFYTVSSNNPRLAQQGLDQGSVEAKPSAAGLAVLLVAKVVCHYLGFFNIAE